MIELVAIDGGGDQQRGAQEVRGTGWAALSLPDDGPPVLRATGLIPGGPTPFLHELGRSSELRQYVAVADQLVVENFKLLNSRAKIDPLEIVGMVRMWGMIYHVPVAVQMPAQRTIVSHDDLKRIGMWPGGKGHADEAQAVRHGLAWASLQGHAPTIGLLSPDPEGQPEEDHPPAPGAW